jgi:hypothetical protein
VGLLKTLVRDMIEGAVIKTTHLVGKTHLTGPGAGEGIVLTKGILELERQAMSLEFPQFQYKHKLINGRSFECWEGYITPIPELDRSFKIRGEYRENYPPSIPKIYGMWPRLSKSKIPKHPHLNGDGSLCIFLPSDPQIQTKIWKPEQNTMADMLYLTSEWLICHLYWERYEIWPKESAPCGEDYIKRHIGKNDDCYCGSGKKFMNCCMKKKE